MLVQKFWLVSHVELDEMSSTEDIYLLNNTYISL